MASLLPNAPPLDPRSCGGAVRPSAIGFRPLACPSVAIRREGACPRPQWPAPNGSSPVDCPQWTIRDRRPHEPAPPSAALSFRNRPPRPVGGSIGMGPFARPSGPRVHWSLRRAEPRPEFGRGSSNGLPIGRSGLAPGWRGGSCRTPMDPASRGPSLPLPSPSIGHPLPAPGRSPQAAPRLNGTPMAEGSLQAAAHAVATHAVTVGPCSVAPVPSWAGSSLHWLSPLPLAARFAERRTALPGGRPASGRLPSATARG